MGGPGYILFASSPQDLDALVAWETILGLYAAVAQFPGWEGLDSVIMMLVEVVGCAEVGGGGGGGGGGEIKENIQQWGVDALCWSGCVCVCVWEGGREGGRGRAGGRGEGD